MLQHRWFSLLRTLIFVVGFLAVPAASRAATSQALGAPVLLWRNGGCTSWCQTGWYASPAVADLDGDGKAEVVWGSYDLVALNGVDGSLKWRAPSGSRVWPSIAVADLTGDGTLEVIVGRSGDQVTVYNRNGSVAWTKNPFGNGEVRTLAVDDLEQDGKREIIVGRASGGSTKQLSVYEPDGGVRPGWPARRNGEAGYGWGMYNQNVVVADINGDGNKELFGPTDTHYITGLDRNGNQLPVNLVYGAGKVWSQVGVHVSNEVDLRGYANCGTEHRPNFANSAPAAADLDGDGTQELIVVGNVYNCGIDPYTDLYLSPFVFKADRTRWSGSGFDWTTIPTPDALSGPRSEDYNLIESALPNAVPADLDGDGRKEILFPSYDGRLHAFWLDKTEHGNWPFRVPGNGIRFAGEPAVVDLDGDGQAEVIFTSWPQKNSGGVGQLHILDSQGRTRFAVDLPAPSSGSWNGGLGAPTVANIDGDTDMEVVVGTVASGAVAYDLPGSGDARCLWCTGRGSLLRTGVAAASDGFTLQGTPGVATIEPGGTATWIINAKADGMFRGPLTLSATSDNVALQVQLGTGSLDLPGTTTLRVNDISGSGKANGYHRITLTASGSGLERTVTLGLFVGGVRHYLPLAHQP